MGSRDWIDLARDAETGIETLRAHFEGHAYDPHWHDSYLIGYTEIGVQQFNCRRRRHDSTAGQVFLVEPGEIHDGRAPIAGGFTYSMLYLQPDWLRRELRATFDDAPSDRDPGFHANLTEDPRLTLAIAQAFRVLHGRELRLLRQTALELVLERLRVHLGWREAKPFDPRLPLVAQKARDYLHRGHRPGRAGQRLRHRPLPPEPCIQGRLRLATLRLPGPVAPGQGAADARCRRATGGPRQRSRFRRPEPSRPLVPARLRDDPGGLPPAVHPASRLRPGASPG